MIPTSIEGTKLHTNGDERLRSGCGEALLDNSQKVSTALGRRDESKRSRAITRPGSAAETEGSLKPFRVDAWELAWRQEEWGVEGATCGSETAEKLDGDVVRVVPMLCGKWSCPVCGRLKYRWFVRNVKNAVEDHRLKFFWTLTIAHGTVSPMESWGLISSAWNRFRIALERAGFPITYIWVVEPQQSGHAHMHVLWDLWVPHSVVKALWMKATGGSYIVQFERVRDDKAAHYLAKYCQKLAGRVLEVEGFGEISNKHRFAKSRVIKFSEFRQKSEGWRRYQQSYKAALKFFERQNRVVERREFGVPSFAYGARYSGPWLSELSQRRPVLLEGQLPDRLTGKGLYEVLPPGATLSARIKEAVGRINQERRQL